MVDTPGIGENNEMKQLLLDYIAENEIYGFIYVIKSDNAGGLAKDRVTVTACLTILQLTWSGSEYGSQGSINMLSMIEK